MTLNTKLRPDIEQLVRDAGFSFWEDEHWGPGPGNIDWSCNYNLELEKFADLLITKCANIARDYTQHFADDDTALWLRSQILDHFEDADTKDMMGEKCQQCNKSTYRETSIHDDMDGVLHCGECNHEINRWT